MADKFRRILDERTGPGGVTCDCCNNYKGKGRKILHRLARRKMKEDTEKEIERTFIEEDSNNKE